MLVCADDQVVIVQKEEDLNITITKGRISQSVSEIQFNKSEQQSAVEGERNAEVDEEI